MAARRTSPKGRASSGSKAPKQSLLDVAVTSVDRVPVEVPSAKYLAETLLGLRGSDQTVPDEVKSSIGNKPSEGPGVSRSWKRMKLVCGADAANDALTAMFWICAGIIFKCVKPEALGDFREKLAQSWYRVNLEATEKSAGRTLDDTEARDQILEALPFVFAQAVFRLLMDVFELDRASLLSNSGPLLERINLVCHFETTGFQINSDTCHKTRRKYFRNRVLENPHLNQIDLIRGLERQEELQKQNKSAQNQPLRFGQRKAKPLEEIQLEHVMWQRAMKKKEAMRARLLRASSAHDGDMEESSVPEDLEVEKYEKFVENAKEMLQQHQLELRLNGKDADAETPHGHHDDGTSDGSPLSPGSESPILRTRSPLDLPVDAVRRAPLQRMSPLQRLQNAARGVIMSHGMSEGSQKAEREAAERRRREEFIEARLTGCPLPKEVSSKEFTTTWVSPVIAQISRASSHSTLRKTAAESLRVKMAVPTAMSSPKAASGKNQTQAVRRSAEVSDAGFAAGSTSSPPQARSSSEKVGFARQRTTIAGASEPLVLEGRVGKKDPLPPGFELISLQPPQRLDGDVIMQRLKTTRRLFQEKSFGEYMKEYDILTGKKKQRADAQRLKKDELAYVKSMQNLVGPPGSDLRFRRSESLMLQRP